MTTRWKWIVLGAVALAGAAALAAWWFGPVAVEVAAPVRATAVEAIYATGSVEPSVMLPISSRVAGTLVELAADEGSHVRKGQVLARLEDTDLRSTVDEQTARAKYARENYERTEDLVRRGFVSAGELDRTRSDMDAADAALRRAHTLRDFTALVAPADGVIIRRDGEVGQYLAAGQALFSMACCAPLRIAVEVDEEDILRVRVGQKVLMHTDALAGRSLDGVVVQVTPKGDPVSRSYRVRIRPDDPAELRVGMTIDANLIAAERPRALLVPTSAVQGGAVWLVRDGRLHRQPVRTGVVGVDRTEILEGIDDASLVVVVPTDKLAEDRRAHATLLGSAGTALAPAAASVGTPAGNTRNGASGNATNPP